MRNDRIRLIVEIALTIALAAVLNSLKLWRMPQGGTISLVMLPIVVLSLRRGLGPGVIAGCLYGIVDLLVDYQPPVHPVQFLLDYPVAYAAVGLSGLFAPAWKSWAARSRWSRGIVIAVLPATVLGTVARYASHVISGAVFFGQYAPKGQPVWIYSALYNSVILLSGLLAFVAAAVVLPSLTRALDERSAPSAQARHDA